MEEYIENKIEKIAESVNEISLEINELNGKDIEYLEEKFPKGDKRRGEAMVLLALARMEGKK